MGTVGPDRGRPERVRPLGPWLKNLPRGPGVFQGCVDQFAAWLALAVWERNFDEARSGMQLALKQVPEDFLRGASGGELFWRALWAEADRAAVARARHDDGEVLESVALAQDWLERITALTDHPDPWGVTASPKVGAYLSLCRAERDRVEGRDEPETWQAAVVDLDGFGVRFPAAYARFRLAESLVRTGGDRGRAAEVLEAARGTARRLGAVPLLAEIDSLGRRARLLGIDADDPDGDIDADTTPGAELGLSPREREVLMLVADGATNRQIAEVLYISPKTASVHVSNILAKFGVASRGEAAAVAHRLGVVHR